MKYTGRICQKHPGAFGERYVVQNRCVACMRERVEKWTQANPEKKKASTKAYREANPKKIAAIKNAWEKANHENLSVRRKLYRAANAEKIAARAKAHREANPEQGVARSKAYYAANSEKIKACSKASGKARYEASPEKEIARKKAWRAANPDKSNAITGRRRATKLNATPVWANKSAIDAFYETAEGLNMLLGEWHHVDHIVPLKSKIVCGLHVEHNLQVLTMSDNISKGNRHWPDMPSRVSASGIYTCSR